ncbi:hypothetical protein PIB30_099991 [Stylosanthes scabra]|uniref:Uncharacterized protein n=1 Tax=Stylosanthes scabra TaxID=79078 RepID=A0ABU6SZE4_9FABA|nr:hypothetical protein [Stylosanthes scabra]
MGRTELILMPLTLRPCQQHGDLNDTDSILCKLHYCYDEPVLDERGVLYKGLPDRSIEMSEFGSESKGLAVILHRAYDKAYAEMVDFKAKEKGGKIVMTHQEGSLDGMNDLHSPTRVKSIGRPRKRLGSTLEKQIASSSNKKKRKALTEVNVENSRPFD